MPETVKLAWPEVLIEGALLGVFMISAGGFATLLEHPASPLHSWIAGDGSRRALMGLAMGLTAVLLIYSPAGKRSGAHMNPAVTLAFFRLGHVDARTAIGYTAAQVTGGALGLALLGALLGRELAHPRVNWVATLPGPMGPLVAFAAETAMAFVLMLVVLAATASPRLERFTGLLAGALVAAFITLEAPISGMSLNPARSLASALNGSIWNHVWVYLTAPFLGMLAAAQVFCAVAAGHAGCAKLHHENAERCIFCGKPAAASRASAVSSAAGAGGPGRSGTAWEEST